MGVHAGLDNKDSESDIDKTDTRSIESVVRILHLILNECIFTIVFAVVLAEV